MQLIVITPLIPMALTHGRARPYGGPFAQSAFDHPEAPRGNRMAFESLLAYPRVDSRTLPKVEDGAEACSCALALDGASGHAYNEEAFRYFLKIERTRAQNANRSFLLLLVTLRGIRGRNGNLTPDQGARLLEALGFCVREVDFIGWYRDGRIAGAVLTQGNHTPGRSTSDRIGERVTKVLQQRLPGDLAQRLRVRVVERLREPA